MESCTKISVIFVQTFFLRRELPALWKHSLDFRCTLCPLWVLRMLRKNLEFFVDMQKVLRHDSFRTVESILSTISCLRKYWKCLSFQDPAAKSRRVSDKDKDLWVLLIYSMAMASSINNSIYMSMPITTFCFQTPTFQPRIRFDPPPEPLGNEAYCQTVWYSPTETVELRHEINDLKSLYDCFRGGYNRTRRLVLDRFRPSPVEYAHPRKMF